MAKRPGSYRVVPKANGGWDVKKDDATSRSGHFDKKQDAIDAGRKISQNQGIEFYIHGKDGKIQNKDSHGNDSYPSRGNAQINSIPFSMCAAMSNARLGKSKRPIGKSA